MHLKIFFKRSIALCMSLVMCLGLCGCGLIPTLELSDHQMKLVAEYAAGLLLEHQRGYGGSLTKLAPGQEFNIELLKEEEQIKAEEPLDEISEDIDDSRSDEGSDSVTMPAGDHLYSAGSIAAAIGIDDFEITYTDYEIVDTYPREESDDLVFSMQAAPGMELIILHFNLANTTEEEKLCDILDQAANFRIVINDSERVNEQVTILMNDLRQFKDDVNGYGMIDTVLVFEVAKGTGDGIDKLDLIVTSYGEESRFKIY